MSESTRCCGSIASILPASAFPDILSFMEVHFTPEEEAELSKMAGKIGTNAEHLVKDAALRLLEEESRFLAAVEKGIAAADRGEFIEEEEMSARIDRMFKP
jgi:predicted transcriptional regulator